MLSLIQVLFNCTVTGSQFFGKSCSLKKTKETKTKKKKNMNKVANRAFPYVPCPFLEVRAILAVGEEATQINVADH